ALRLWNVLENHCPAILDRETSSQGKCLGSFGFVDFLFLVSENHYPDLIYSNRCRPVFHLFLNPSASLSLLLDERVFSSHRRLPCFFLFLSLSICSIIPIILVDFLRCVYALYVCRLSNWANLTSPNCGICAFCRLWPVWLMV